MRILRLIPLSTLILLGACNFNRRPSDTVFRKEIDQYLMQRGESCTSIGRSFPIDIPASVQQVQYGFGPQLIALQAAGLVSETDTAAVVHGMLDPLRGTTPPQRVRRYQLTVDGQKSFRQIAGPWGQTGALCYRQKTVDAILKWSNPVTMDGYSQVEVTYTYKIPTLASWAQRADVQAAFPDVASTVNGLSRVTQTVAVQQTSNGWGIP